MEVFSFGSKKMEVWESLGHFWFQSSTIVSNLVSWEWSRLNIEYILPHFMQLDGRTSNCIGTLSEHRKATVLSILIPKQITMACLQKLQMNRLFSMMCSWIVGAMLGCHKTGNFGLQQSPVKPQKECISVLRGHRKDVSQRPWGWEVFFSRPSLGDPIMVSQRPSNQQLWFVVVSCLDVLIIWGVQLFFSGFLLKHLKSKQFRKNHSDGLADSNWLIQAALDQCQEDACLYQCDDNKVYVCIDIYICTRKSDISRLYTIQKNMDMNGYDGSSTITDILC